MKNLVSILRHAVRPLIESLENRQLLSASLDDGVLTVDAGAASDIAVLRRADDYQVTINGYLTSFSASDPNEPVNSIVIDSTDNDDHIVINTALLTSTTINGGDGDDVLTVLGTTGVDYMEFGSAYSLLTDGSLSLNGIESIRFDGRGGGDMLRLTDNLNISIAGSQDFDSLVLENTATASLEVGPASLVKTKEFSLLDSATFNVNSNTLLIDYTAGTSPYAATVDLLKNGMTTLGGNGVGISMSSQIISARSGTTLTVVDNGSRTNPWITTLGGFGAIPFKSVLVTYTWFGDANLDGKVNGSDYALTDTGAGGNAGANDWTMGDFNFDWLAGDYALVDTGFSSQVTNAIGIYNVPPKNVTVMPLWDGAARVAWNTPAFGVKKYIVWVSVDGGDFIKYGETGSNYADYRSAAQATVQFRVAAVYSVGTEAQQAISISMTQLAINSVTNQTDTWLDEDDGGSHDGYPYPELPPAGPNTPGTVETVAYANYIKVKWVDQSSNETKFVVQRSMDGIYFDDVAELNGGTTVNRAYNDYAAIPGLLYWYRVVAVNGNGFSAPSNAASAVRPLLTPAAPTVTAMNWQSVSLSWADNTEYEAGYDIQVSDSSGVISVVQTPGDSTSYAVTGLSKNTSYTFKIMAVGENDADSGWSAGVSATTNQNWGHGTPKAITDLAVESIDGNTVRLTWTDNATDESGYTLRYRVVNGDGTFGEWVSVTINPNGDESGSFDLGGLDPETEYEFELVPLDPDSGGTGAGDPENALNGQFKTDAKAGWAGASHYHGADFHDYTGTYYTDLVYAPATGEWSELPVYYDPAPNGGGYWRDKVYKNESLTYTLEGLPKHAYVSIGVAVQVHSTGSAPQITVKIDGQTVSMVNHVESDDGGGFTHYSGYYMTEGTSFHPYYAMIIGGTTVEHSGTSAAIEITGSGISQQNGGWTLRDMMVSTFLPEVSVSAGKEDPNPPHGTIGTSVTEGSSNKLYYTFTRTVASNAEDAEALDVEVDWTSGTADQEDIDGELPVVHFNKGQTKVVVEVKTKHDTEIEDHETLIAKVTSNAGQGYASVNSVAKGTIEDDEYLVVLIGGHFQSGSTDPTLPEVGSGVRKIYDALTNNGVPAEYIFMTSEDGPDHGASEKRLLDKLKADIALARGRSLGIAMVGYSHGAGLIYTTSKKMASDKNNDGKTDIGNYSLFLTAYIDGIQRWWPYQLPANPETRRPIRSDYHMNWCQSNPFKSELLLAGNLGPNDDFQHDFDSVTNSESHVSIDDNATIGPALAAAINYLD